MARQNAAAKKKAALAAAKKDLMSADEIIGRGTSKNDEELDPPAQAATAESPVAEVAVELETGTEVPADPVPTVVENVQTDVAPPASVEQAPEKLQWPWDKHDPMQKASSYSQTSVYLNDYEREVLKVLRECTMGSQSQWLRKVVKFGVRELAAQIERGEIVLEEA